MEITAMKNPKKQARNLVSKLRKKAKKNPDQFCENYGQKEVRKFRDRMSKADVPYRVQAKVENILSRVAEITPF